VRLCSYYPIDHCDQAFKVRLPFLVAIRVRVFDSGSYPPRHRDGMAHKILVVESGPLKPSESKMSAQKSMDFEIAAIQESLDLKNLAIPQTRIIDATA